MVRNVNLGVFEPKYSSNCRVIAIYGNNHIAVKDTEGKVQVQCRGHIKRIDPVDKVISLIPSTEDYQKFGRKTKLLIHPSNISNTNIVLPERVNAKSTVKESENSKNYPIPHEQEASTDNKSVNSELLNCIDVSLISVSREVPGEFAKADDTYVVQTETSKEGLE